MEIKPRLHTLVHRGIKLAVNAGSSARLAFYVLPTEQSGSNYKLAVVISFIYWAIVQVSDYLPPASTVILNSSKFMSPFKLEVNYFTSRYQLKRTNTTLTISKMLYIWH